MPRQAKNQTKAAVVGAHVGASLVVISERNVVVRTRNKVNAKHKMPKEIRHEFIFYLRLGSGGSIAGISKRQMPFGEIPRRNRKADWEVAERLRPTDSHINGQSVVALCESLHLTAEVCHNERKRKVAVGIVIVYAKVCGKGRKPRIRHTSCIGL